MFRRLIFLLAIITLLLTGYGVMAQEATPEATPEAPTTLTLPPAMEALVGVWDTEAPSGDDNVSAQMIFFPNIAVFELVETGKKNYIGLGTYEIVDDTHLDASVQGLGVVGGLGSLGGVPGQIGILDLTDDTATLIITIPSNKSETTLKLKRTAEYEDNSAQLVGTWKAPNSESSTEFRDDNTVNLSTNSLSSIAGKVVITYFLHGKRLELLIVIESKSTIGATEVTTKLINPAPSVDVVFADEGGLEFHDPETGEISGTLERVQP